MELMEERRRNYRGKGTRCEGHDSRRSCRAQKRKKGRFLHSPQLSMKEKDWRGKKREPGGNGSRIFVEVRGKSSRDEKKKGSEEQRRYTTEKGRTGQQRWTTMVADQQQQKSNNPDHNIFR